MSVQSGGGNSTARIRGKQPNLRQENLNPSKPAQNQSSVNVGGSPNPSVESIVEDESNQSPSSGSENLLQQMGKIERHHTTSLSNSPVNTRNLIQAYFSDERASAPSPQTNTDKPRVEISVVAGLTFGFGLILFGFQTGNILFTLAGSLLSLATIIHHAD